VPFHDAGEVIEQALLRDGGEEPEAAQVDSKHRFAQRCGETGGVQECAITSHRDKQVGLLRERGALQVTVRHPHLLRLVAGE